MNRLAPLFLAATLLGGVAPAVALAQVGAPPRAPAGAPLAQVTLHYGAALNGMLDRYGKQEVADLAAVLKRKVELAAPKGGFTRVDLVLEDARPTRPTLAQQSRITSLSSRSKALGGAIVTGTVYRADGTSQPLTFSWFETDLRTSFASSTWSDAEQAFDVLARDLARGKVSSKLGPGTPNRYNCTGAFDAWCTN